MQNPHTKTEKWTQRDGREEEERWKGWGKQHKRGERPDSNLNYTNCTVKAPVPETRGLGLAVKHRTGQDKTFKSSDGAGMQ